MDTGLPRRPGDPACVSELLSGIMIKIVNIVSTITIRKLFAEIFNVFIRKVEVGYRGLVVCLGQQFTLTVTNWY